MPPKRLYTNRSLPTDLPSSITYGASRSFDNYLRSRKRVRVDENQQTSLSSTEVHPADKDTTEINPNPLVPPYNEAAAVHVPDTEANDQQDLTAEAQLDYPITSEEKMHSHTPPLINEDLQNNIMIPQSHDSEDSDTTQALTTVEQHQHNDKETNSHSQLIKAMARGLQYAACVVKCFHIYISERPHTFFSGTVCYSPGSGYVNIRIGTEVIVVLISETKSIKLL